MSLGKCLTIFYLEVFVLCLYVKNESLVGIVACSQHSGGQENLKFMASLDCILRFCFK